MQKYSLNEHLTELKKRLFIALIFFLINCCICFYYSDYLTSIFLKPLTELKDFQGKKIIYTGLTEAFFAQIKLSFFTAIIVGFPFFLWQIYAFMAPGLAKSEKKLVRLILFFSPCLFYFGIIFVYYLIMPKAWQFFLNYENTNSQVPLLLEAKISEYLDLATKFCLIFGLAFQLPILLLILHTLTIIDVKFLQGKRKLAIVTIFIVAALFTPPDVISQIGLAIPLILLYEFSIKLCSLIDQKERNVRSEMDKRE